MTTEISEESTIPVVLGGPNNDDDDGESGEEKVAEEQQPVVLDPSKLTLIEIGWAKEIKRIAAEDAENFALEFTDLEYAQIALITKGKFDRAMTMIRNIVSFKKEHGIIDADRGSVAVDDISNLVEKAIESIILFEKKSPGFMMSFAVPKQNEQQQQQQTSNNEEDSTAAAIRSSSSAVIAFNFTAFNPRKYKTQDEWKLLFTALYYLFEASSSTVNDMRSGCSFICNCDLIGFDNYSNDLTKYGSGLYEDSYPIRVKDITCLNTPFIFRTIYAICKPFVSVHTTQVLTMGGSLSGIQSRFGPDVLPKSMDGKLGNWELRKNLIAALKSRYESKATFTL